MHAIEDRSGYLELMKSSLDDKLFFLDSEEVNQASIFVDFGCAGGTLTRRIAKELPGAIVIGYDSDDEMIRIARSHPSNAELPGLIYTNNWEYVKRRIYETDDRLSAIVLSSVLHEVASEDRMQLEKLFLDINGMGFNYVVIRDMLLHPATNSKVIPETIKRKLKELAGKDEEFARQLDSFYAYGQRYRTKYSDLIHFLLKMDYKNNWDRENEENYLSLHYNDFTDFPYLYDYTFVHFEHYMLPYLKKHWKDVLGAVINVPTHVKVILKRLSE